VTLALCAACLAIGALVRLLPCWNDFWLDEIWSWESARALTSPLAGFWWGVYRNLAAPSGVR
jgi:hypothetical protein